MHSFLMDVSINSDVPAGFKKMDLPVVKFDSIKAVGNGGDGESTEGNNEFIIHPEGEITTHSSLQLHLRVITYNC